MRTGMHLKSLLDLINDEIEQSIDYNTEVVIRTIETIAEKLNLSVEQVAYDLFYSSKTGLEAMQKFMHLEYLILDRDKLEFVYNLYQQQQITDTIMDLCVTIYNTFEHLGLSESFIKAAGTYDGVTKVSRVNEETVGTIMSSIMYYSHLGDQFVRNYIESMFMYSDEVIMEATKYFNKSVIKGEFEFSKYIQMLSYVVDHCGGIDEFRKREDVGSLVIMIFNNLSIFRMMPDGTFKKIVNAKGKSELRSALLSEDVMIKGEYLENMLRKHNLYYVMREENNVETPQIAMTIIERFTEMPLGLSLLEWFLNYGHNMYADTFEAFINDPDAVLFMSDLIANPRATVSSDQLLILGKVYQMLRNVGDIDGAESLKWISQDYVREITNSTLGLVRDLLLTHRHNKEKITMLGALLFDTPFKVLSVVMSMDVEGSQGDYECIARIAEVILDESYYEISLLDFCDSIVLLVDNSQEFLEMSLEGRQHIYNLMHDLRDSTVVDELNKIFAIKNANKFEDVLKGMSLEEINMFTTYLNNR